MEQDLNKEFETDLYHFKLHHKNQNLNNNSEYENWKKNAIDYINRENKNSIDEYIKLINFCNNCCSYSIFSTYLFSLIECHNCHYKFCIGCGKKPLSNRDYSTCLKGFIKMNYLRAFNESTKILSFHPILCILHIIFSLFFTPQYIGYIFNMLGFLQHQRISRLKNNGEIHDFTDNENKLLTIHIYSIIKGFLFFPYTITFLPFIVILLSLGVFSKENYMKVLAFYCTIAHAGGMEVKNKYW